MRSSCSFRAGTARRGRSRHGERRTEQLCAAHEVERGLPTQPDVHPGQSLCRGGRLGYVCVRGDLERRCAGRRPYIGHHGRRPAHAGRFRRRADAVVDRHDVIDGRFLAQHRPAAQRDRYHVYAHRARHADADRDAARNRCSVAELLSDLAERARTGLARPGMQSRLRRERIKTRIRTSTARSSWQ